MLTKLYFLNSRRLKTILVVLFIGFFSFSFGLQSQESKEKTHKVVSGETLTQISKLYNVSVDQILLWNGLSNANIRIGQKLIIGYQKEQAIEKDSADGRNYTQAMELLVDKVQALYFDVLAANKAPQESYERVFMRSIFSEFDENVFSTNALNDLNFELIEALKADVGLDFYSSAVYNFEPGITDSEDLFYRSRINAGLDWQILKSGLVGNKRKIKELELQNQINTLTKLQARQETQYVYLYNYIIYLFNKRQLDYVQQRIEIIDNFLEISGQMYLVRATPWEEIIALRNRKETLENIQRNLSRYNEGFESTYSELSFKQDVNVDKLPLIELDAQRIFKGVEIDSVDNRLDELLKKQFEYKYNKNRDLSLRAYLRYNIYDDGDFTTEGIRTYSSIGATFSAPLFQNKNNQQIAEKELAVIQSENARRQQEVNNSLLNQYYEYEYVFKSYMEFYGNKGVVLERLRRELTKDDMNDLSFSPLNAIHQIDQLYAIETDLLDIKQNLYLKILRIYTDMGLENSTEIGDEVVFDGFFDKVVGERSLYLWSKSFERFPTQFLSNYIANNDFRKIYLSPGQVGKEKIKEFIQLEKLQRVAIYRLVGENSYAKDGNIQGLLKITDEINSSEYKGIHLDIEPHTFEDWDTKKEEYLKNLLKVTKAARQSLDSTKAISMSIPNNYPVSTIESLVELVDEMVVMSYERPEIEFVIRKLEEERRVVGDKLVVAFRTKDFKDRVVMEEFILEFIQRTGIENIAIHDLDQLIRLDQKTISGK